jgi:sporulation protein YunB
MKLKTALRFCKVLIFLFLILFIIGFIRGYFSKRVEVYIAQKARLEASRIIAEAISTSVLPNINLEGLVKTIGDETEIKSIYINTQQINEIMAETTLTIQKELAQIEKNKKLNNLVLPFSVIIGDFLLYKYGPDIYINIYPVSGIVCDVVTTFDNYGINNTLLEINIIVEITLATVVPLQKQEIPIQTKIPILVQVIQGKVPSYYYYNTDSKYLPNPIKID